MTPDSEATCRGAVARGNGLDLDPAEHVALFLAHHIASDGWSVGVFCRDLSELYGARQTGRTPRLPELPLQYRDFALWQRRRLRGERFESEIAYWRAQLGGAPTILQLPTDRPRPPRQKYEGASHELVLPREAAEDVLRLCRDEEATPYILLLSVFAALPLPPDRTRRHPRRRAVCQSRPH